MSIALNPEQLKNRIEEKLSRRDGENLWRVVNPEAIRTSQDGRLTGNIYDLQIRKSGTIDPNELKMVIAELLAENEIEVYQAGSTVIVRDRVQRSCTEKPIYHELYCGNVQCHWRGGIQQVAVFADGMFEEHVKEEDGKFFLVNYQKKDSVDELIPIRVE